MAHETNHEAASETVNRSVPADSGPGLATRDKSQSLPESQAPQPQNEMPTSLCRLKKSCPPGTDGYFHERAGRRAGQALGGQSKGVCTRVCTEFRSLAGLARSAAKGKRLLHCFPHKSRTTHCSNLPEVPELASAEQGPELRASC